jgi:hypothetical protein
MTLDPLASTAEIGSNLMPLPKLKKTPVNTSEGAKTSAELVLVNVTDSLVPVKLKSADAAKF